MQRGSGQSSRRVADQARRCHPLALAAHRTRTAFKHLTSRKRPVRVSPCPPLLVDWVEVRRARRERKRRKMAAPPAAPGLANQRAGLLLGPVPCFCPTAVRHLRAMLPALVVGTAWCALCSEASELVLAWSERAGRVVELCKAAGRTKYRRLLSNWLECAQCVVETADPLLPRQIPCLPSCR